MATRTCKIFGILPVDSASITVLFDGVQVISGAIDTTGWAEPAVTKNVIGTFTFESTATDLEDHTLSISCTAGSISAGVLYFDAGTGRNNTNPSLGDENITSDSSDPLIGDGYWLPSNSAPYGDGSDTALAERSNILINGVAPAYDEDFIPTGTAENPTWTGWDFYIAAGETLSCTARVPGQWVAKEAIEAGSFVIGTRYEITIIGDTDFTTIGASLNEVGKTFYATGSGTGTGTAIVILAD